jgi:hypothetical protein
MLKFLLVLVYYDRPTIAKNALNTIAELQSDNWELAIIDDNSPRPIKPIAEEILKNHLHKVKFYNTEDPIEERKVRGGIFGKFINQAMDESDADVVMIVCDDDAVVSDALINLSAWFEAHPDKMYCYSHVIPYDPSRETAGPHLPRAYHYTNFLHTLAPACQVDASQVVFRKTCHDSGNVWFPHPSTCNLDAHIFGQLNACYGPADFSGCAAQYKGWFSGQLGKRGGPNMYTTGDN